MVVSAFDALLGADRAVGRAFNAPAGWRARLASDPEGCADEDPLLGLRRVAAKSTGDGLAQQSASMADEALRDARRQWGRARGMARPELFYERTQPHPSPETRALLRG